MHGKPIILFLWFGTTPFLVVLFTHLNWGTDGIIAAIVLSSLVWWLISFTAKRVMGIFPSKSAAMHFLASGQMPQETRAIASYGQRDERDGEDTEEEDAYSEEEYVPQTGPIVDDLHPAVARPGVPAHLRPENRYRLNLGSHTLDLDVALDQALIVERLPETTQSLTRILAEEFGGRLQFALVLVDFTDAFQSLLAELPKSFLMSGSEKHHELPAKLRQRAVQVDRGNAAQLGRALMQERGQCIFRFGSFESYVEACANFLLLLQGIHRWEKEHIAGSGRPIPCVIIITQAHLFLPHDNSYSIAAPSPTIAQALPAHLLHYLQSHGERGMYLYLVSEYASRMRREALTESGLWLLREPQYEELYYLSQTTGLDLMAQMRRLQANQALLFDVVGRTSFPVTLRQSHSLFEVEALHMTLSPTLFTAALPAPEIVSEPEASARLVTSTVSVGAATERDEATDKVVETPGGFTEMWLAYASFLYSINRLTPSALQQIPSELLDMALALGFTPVRGQDMINRDKARRLIGVIEGIGAEKRAHYASRARAHAPAYLQRGRGGLLKAGTDPPSPWSLPRLTLLRRSEATQAITPQEVAETARLIVRLLAQYDVYVDIREQECAVGHTITRYAARPAGKPKLKFNAAKGVMEGVRDQGGMLLYDRMTTVDQIEAKEEDLATKLAADTVRIARVAGKPFVGIEIPHAEEARTSVSLRDILAAPAYQQRLATSKVLFPLGKDVAGEVRFLDLASPDHPHLLIGGASGGGKSVFLQAGITSIALQATPDDVRMWLIDPKRVDFKPFDGLPHLIGGRIVTQVEAIPTVIGEALAEVERRYRFFERLGVANLERYRRLRSERSETGDRSLKNLPELLLIIDELGDALMVSPQEVEEDLCRLGQIGRAAGLHLVLATQRPEVNIVKGRIKANLPFRVALRVSSVDDSKVILGRGGAHLLVGRGDMLAGMSGRYERLQGALVEEEEAELVVAHWRQQAARLHPASPFVEEQPQPDERPGSRDEAERQVEQEDESGEVLQKVVAELPQRTVVSVNMIKKVYHVSHDTAQPIIEQLLERGLIGQYSASLKGHPVRVVNLQQRLGRDASQDESSDEEERSLSS